MQLGIENNLKLSTLNFKQQKRLLQSWAAAYYFVQPLNGSKSLSWDVYWHPSFYCSGIACYYKSAR